MITHGHFVTYIVAAKKTSPYNWMGVFVGANQLKAGDSVLFIREERSQLMMGVRHANRQQAMLPSSVLSADSMHISVLAAAAHAAANRSQFTIFYNPRYPVFNISRLLRRHDKIGAIWGVQYLQTQL